MREDVSVSVVTHNSEKHIGELLDSLLGQTRGVSIRIIVVDNASRDKTAEEASARGVEVIENGFNAGFGRAHNRALGLSDSQYHLIVNPDVYFDNDVIAGMADYMEGKPEIGMLSPKVLFPNGEPQPLPRREPRIIYLISRRLDLSLLEKYRREYEMGEKNSDEAFDIEFATGCFMFARTRLLKELGGFDERFFLYFEDADLSRRMRGLARIEYNPSFTVYHRWERAGAKNARMFGLQTVSMFKYFWKWG